MIRALLPTLHALQLLLAAVAVACSFMGRVL